VNAFVGFLLILYVWKNYVNPDVAGAGAAGGFNKADQYAGGLTSNAYLEGEAMEIRTHGEFEKLIQQHELDTGLPVIVDFHSRGCGPCRQIAPYFNALAKSLQGEAVFGKVNVNENRVTSQELGIRAMPTFVFFLNGKMRHRFSGADGGQLEKVSRLLADEAREFMELGTFPNHQVTDEALTAFYEAHDPAKANGVNETLQKYESKTAQLMRGLKQKYDAVPKISPRPVALSPAAAAAAAAATPAMASAPGSSLASVSTEALEKELAWRREEASGEDLFTPAASLAAQKTLENVVIVGGGPAGLSAAIYGKRLFWAKELRSRFFALTVSPSQFFAPPPHHGDSSFAPPAARAGLKPVVLAPSFGGQLLGKGVDVENYPGVVGVDATGRGIIELMRKQAASFAVRLVPEAVTAVVPRSGSAGRNEFELVLNDTATTSVRSRSIILATGAASRWLGIDGEYEFRGSGVSTCATCDGFLYRDKKVVVIGGGDTAMEDALVLARTSAKVTVVHRRGSFRASHALAERVLAHEKITVLWHATVLKFEGSTEGGLEALRVQVKGAKKNDIEQTIPCAAAFVAIGHDPVTEFVRDTGMKMDAGGYVLTGREAMSIKAEAASSTATSVAGIFAAGDVSDHVYRQAITSAGSGAMAALDAERYLSS
jgi:thioredoxin reductase (NADPH)